MTGNHWDEYWRSGVLTTLTVFEHGYTGEFAGFWHGLVDPLPEHACIVDLATGNGAVPFAVMQRAQTLGCRFEVIGVDSADISPMANLKRDHPARGLLANVRFVGGTDLRDTGLPAGSADLVTSQYGIEYTALDEAVRECARLLKPGGRLGAIMHSVDSDVFRQSARVGALMGALVDEAGIPERVRALVRAHAEAAGPARVKACRAALDAGLVTVRRRIDDREILLTFEGFCSQVLAPLGPGSAWPLAEKLRRIDAVEAEARSLKARLETLARASLDDAAIARLGQLLGEAGMQAERSGRLLFGDQRENVGHALVARRL